MKAPDVTARPRRSEHDLLGAVARHYAAQGCTTYLDPDGASFFDLAVRRGEEVGLVEGKVGGLRNVLGQALRRRAWADWVAVAIDAPRAAERLRLRTAAGRARVVGILLVGPTGLTELRAPGRRPLVPDDDPFAPLRARFRLALDAIDRGERPDGVGWSGVPSAVRHASGGRRFAEWRLDEPGPPAAQPAATSAPATRSGSNRDA